MAVRQAPLTSFVYTHDASNTHFTTPHTVDRHASGTINETYTTVDQYDTNGFLTLETYHQHYDGENDFTTNTGYTYDASGNLTRRPSR